MGISIGTPAWQTAVPVEFESFNPLIKGPVKLEMYSILVPVVDPKTNMVLEERQEYIVTHASLLRYFMTRLMPFGWKKSFMPMVGMKDKNFEGIAMKCVIEKDMTCSELAEAGIFRSAGYTVHLESVAEANDNNTATLISKKHLVETAENRAFDRTMIQLLSLDTSEYGGATLHSSSAEIEGKLVETPVPEAKPAPVIQPMSAKANPVPAPVQTVPSGNTPAPVPKQATEAPVLSNKSDDDLPVWLQKSPEKSETSNQKTPEPLKQPPVQEQEKTAAQDEKKSFAKQPEKETIEERLKASKERYSEKEYEMMLEQPFHFTNSPLDGKPFRIVIDSLKEETDQKKDAHYTVLAFLNNTPYRKETRVWWKIFISYLVKEGLLSVYEKSGRIFLK